MSSVNYDPIKAHEYYMKHRKLKGRHSTKGFTDTQKEQWAYAKDQLAEEHKGINAGITAEKREDTRNVSEDVKEKKQMLMDTARSKIEALKAKMEGMTKEEKAEFKEQIKSVIDSIKATLKQDKDDATAEGAEAKEEIKENAKSAKEQEKNDYEARKDKAYERIKGGK